MLLSGEVYFAGFLYF